MSRNKIAIVLVLINLCCVAAAEANDPTGGYFNGTEIECPGIERSEATVISCNKAAYQKADKELNAVYSELVSAADKKEKTMLRDMQRAWVALKNTQCALAGYYHRTVTAEKWTSECEAIMTIRRVQELKALGTGIKW